MYMTNRYMKRCSASLIIREIQIKSRVKYHPTPVRMVKKPTNNKCWPGCGKKVKLVHFWWCFSFLKRSEPKQSRLIWWLHRVTGHHSPLYPASLPCPTGSFHLQVEDMASALPSSATPRQQGRKRKRGAHSLLCKSTTWQLSTMSLLSASPRPEPRRQLQWKAREAYGSTAFP